MIDSEPIFLRSCNRVFKRLDLNVPDEVIVGLTGRSSQSGGLLLRPYIEGKVSIDEIWKLVTTERNEILKNEKIEAKEGIYELFEYLDSHNLDRALGTSADPKRIKDTLVPLKLYDGFKVIVHGDMVNQGKPNPEVFLKTIELADVKPEEAIIFEDSLNGLLAANAANIRCVLIPDMSIVSKKEREKAFLVLENLSEAIPLIESGQL